MVRSDDDESLSFSEARRRMGLDHVRAARQAIEEAERTDAKSRRRHPAQAAAGAPPPPPHPPMPQPAATAVTSEKPTSLNDQVAALTDQVSQLAAAVERLTEAHGSDLVNATDALAAKYEMELAAHRQTVERLLERQDAHIQTLNGLVEKLTQPD